MKGARESSGTKESYGTREPLDPSGIKESNVSKATIPKALREQVWLTHVGRRYESKCIIPWCKNIMTVHDFHVGHDIPESKGGATEIENLRPICARCNLSMGSQYTVQEWSRLSKGEPVGCWGCFWCC